MWRSSDRQAEVARFAERDFKHLIVYGPYGSGKSSVAIRAFLDWAASRPSGSTFYMCAKGLPQIDTVIRREAEAHAASRLLPLNTRRRPWAIATEDGGESEILVAPFGDGEQSALRIQGTTLAGAYIDEATNMPPPLQRMIISRLRVRGARAIWTLNPDAASHWFKTQFIDKIDDGKISGEIMFLGTTDNPSLPQDYYAELDAGLPFEWQKARYIRGEWTSASGLVYPRAGLPFEDGGNIRRVSMPLSATVLSAGVDWASKSVTHAVLVAAQDNAYWVVDEWRWDARDHGQLDEDEQARRMAHQFLSWGSVRWWSVDQTSKGLIHALSQAVRGAVYPSEQTVNDGCAKIARLFTTHKLFVSPDCAGLISELGTYSWPEIDDTRDRPLAVKPVKRNDHGVDALRYWGERVALASRRPWIMGRPAVGSRR